MRGLGTIINIACILAGGLVGNVCGTRLKPRMQETLLNITGVAVLFLSIGGAMEGMLSIADGKLISGGSVMMIVSLAIGAVLGELLDLEGKIESFGEWLKQKTNNAGDNSFVSSFVTASCTVCVGAMTIVGSIEDGISGDYSILLAKGILDAIIVCIMSASNGKGSIFSVIPVAIFQGSFTLIAVFAGPFMPERALANLSLVGSVLIFCVGLNLIREKKIRVANLLPAIMVAAVWGAIK